MLQITQNAAESRDGRSRSLRTHQKAATDAPGRSEQLRTPRWSRMLLITQNASKSRDGRSRPLRVTQNAATESDAPDRSERIRQPRWTLQTAPIDTNCPKLRSELRTGSPQSLHITPNTRTAPNLAPEHDIRTKSDVTTQYPHQIARQNIASAPNLVSGPQKSIKSDQNGQNAQNHSQVSRRSRRIVRF